jgi:hypothetical protein
MTPKNPAPAFATVATELERVQGILAKDSKTFDRDPAELQREAIAQENAKRRQRDVSDMKTFCAGQNAEGYSIASSRNPVPSPVLSWPARATPRPITRANAG